MKNHTYVAIMAGGVGSRFWPGSREARPKQFLDMIGVGKSLIRLTFERFLNLTTADKIFVVTNSAYKNLILEHIPEISEAQILCEPSRNNTAPCICWTAFHLHALDSEANFIIAPSDHIVLKEVQFTQFLQKALDFSEKNDALLTLGIEPTRPDTGYGYINFKKENIDGVHQVERFMEKPDLETAEKFVASGEYLWNAGIFIWKAKNLLKAFKIHAPDVYEILEKGKKLYGTSAEQAFIDENYPKTPNISVDYAIAERAENMFTVPAEFGWSDLGTWGSIHVEMDKDKAENVVQADRAILTNVSNSLIRLPKGKLAVIKNLDDFMVIDEGDVLLIWPKNEEQDIKKVVAEVKNQFGELHL
jgi:mannose-1-phosphate guanylyltransferase